MKNCLIILLVFLGMKLRAQGVSINSGSTWTVSSLSSGNVVVKAGKDYETTATETSLANQTLLKLTGTILVSVNVQQNVGANWDSRLKLFVRRTGAGTGLAVILGGSSYQQVTTASAGLFTVALGALVGKDDVPIQYQITGLSVLLPAKAYSTTILYTVTGL